MRLKLSKSRVYDYKGKTYYRYSLRLPSALVKERNWQDRKELEIIFIA